MSIRVALKSPKKEFNQRKVSYLVDRWKKVNDKKYEHILRVWYRFKMETMKDYHNLYLKHYVLLLDDVFEE